jgi:hypothetical protein
MKFLRTNRGPSPEDESAAMRLIAITSRSKGQDSSVPNAPAIEDRAEIPTATAEWSIQN